MTDLTAPLLCGRSGCDYACTEEALYCCHPCAVADGVGWPPGDQVAHTQACVARKAGQPWPEAEPLQDLPVDHPVVEPLPDPDDFPAPTPQDVDPQ